jgi:tape measure domain-containing protein
MADERLGFELDIDVEARRLPQTVQQLALMEGHLSRLDRSIERFERSARAMDASAGRMRNVAGSITELSSAIGLLSRGLAVGASAFAAFDRGGDVAIKAMGERSASIRAYTQLLGGDKRGAALEFYRAQEFAQKTDFSSAQIEQSQARLMAQGFRGRDLYATLFSAADLAAVMPGDKNQTLERVTMAMSQIRGKGKLQGEDLTGQLAEAGLNTTLVKQQLAKSLGIKVGDVDKRISSGGVSADVALPAIQRAILAQLGTSRAGEFAMGSAGSLTALISNRDEAIQNVLKGFDADANLPAMDRYKKALQEQGKLFDINSKTGRDLSLVIQDLSNASLEAKSAWTEFSSGLIESFAENYSRNLRANGRDFNPEFTSQALRNLGEAIGRLGTLASIAVGGVNGASGGLAQRLANAFNKDVDMWTAVMDGRYGEAAKLAAGSLMDRVPGTRAAKELARSVYDWEAGGNLESREDKGFTPRMGRTGPTIPTDTASRKAEQKRLEAAAKSGKSDAYRGVFWDYQFDGSIGVWAKPPSVESLSAAQQVSVRGISQAIQSQAGQQQIVINVNGYNKDKMELARALAEEIGRVARSPR